MRFDHSHGLPFVDPFATVQTLVEFQARDPIALPLELASPVPVDTFDLVAATRRANTDSHHWPHPLHSPLGRNEKIVHVRLRVTHQLAFGYYTSEQFPHGREIDGVPSALGEMRWWGHSEFVLRRRHRLASAGGCVPTRGDHADTSRYSAPPVIATGGTLGEVLSGGIYSEQISNGGENGLPKSGESERIAPSGRALSGLRRMKGWVHGRSRHDTQGGPLPA